MPHLIYEMTDNLDTSQTDIAGLLRQSNQVLIDQGGVFPIGGIRSRVHWLRDWCIADGSHPSDAFVHATLKIGAGRSDAVKRVAGDALFGLMQRHFAAQAQQRGLALSLELVEFSEAGTWKHNNIHQRYKKAGA